MEINNTSKEVTSTILFDLHTDEYSVYCTERGKKEHICEVFVKFTESIRHMVHVYFESPTIAQILLDTMNYGISSKRPYKAGQCCDGSINAPVYYLYNQLCSHFHLDSLNLYNEAYKEDMTKEEFESICSFGVWQGVETIKEWNKRIIEKILDSLTEINHHQLRNLLEDKVCDLHYT